MKNVLRTLVIDGWISLTVADTTKMVKEAVRLHRLSHSSAKILGKALSAMTFMSACLKNEKGEISLSLKTEGKAQGIGVSGNKNLRLRGYIENKNLTNEEYVVSLTGNGAFTIVRDDGYAMPFVGTCQIPVSGDLDEAFEEYFSLSEQIPTRIATTVEINGDGGVDFAGVVALQPLPFASDAVLQKMKNTSLTEFLESVKTMGVIDSVEKSFQPDKSVWEEKEAIYQCNCSKEYLSRVLVTLGEEQLKKIIKEDGSVKVHCHYCSADYEFTEEDALSLFR